MDAAIGPVEEMSQNQMPLLVGKKVKHSFNEGSWPGRVLSVVPGFPDFYNIVYDSDCDPSNNVPAAIYSNKLKEDYQNGLLEIVPEVVSHKLQLSLLLNLMNFCHTLKNTMLYVV